ncbi:hypothetical protein NM962_12630 [Mycobacterium sp. SVM_VP21]|nr:hypothetical protein NM962_12630 [Mycobacterium sp. SVM_VP21]
MSTAEIFQGCPPPSGGWRFDPIIEIDGVLQVGCFDAGSQASIAPQCSPFLVRINEQTNRFYRGREPGHVRWSGGKHRVPSVDCWCGWYFTADQGAACIMTLARPHFWVPLRGYAVTEVAAEGVVLGSRTVDEANSWRTSRLLIDGPMYLDLFDADDFGRVQERYPTAVPHVLRSPCRSFDCQFPSGGPPGVPDATISEFLRQVVIDLCAGREVLGERRQVVRGVALALHHGGRRDHLARIAWACMDYARFGERGRLAFECNQHRDFEDLAGESPTVLGTDEILSDPTLTAAEKAVELHWSEMLTGRW